MSYADFDDDFQEADTTKTNEDAPDGSYQCEIKRFFENTTKDGTPRLNCVLQIVAGDHTGKTLFKSWLFTQSAMSYIKADFVRFGLPVESKRFSELVPMLDTNVVGKWCEAVKKDKGHYANVYINAMIDPLPGSKQTKSKKAKKADQVNELLEDAQAVAPESKDDIPF